MLFIIAKNFSNEIAMRSIILLLINKLQKLIDLKLNVLQIKMELYCLQLQRSTAYNLIF